MALAVVVTDQMLLVTFVESATLARYMPKDFLRRGYLTH
jgi:hypothetical protein